jgi:hypothetical protein
MLVVVGVATGCAAGIMNAPPTPAAPVRSPLLDGRCGARLLLTERCELSVTCAAKGVVGAAELSVIGLD